MIYIFLIILAVLFFIAPVRRFVLIRPMMGLMKKAMPSISPTEQAAIDAGTVWWEKSLFRGKPDWQALHAVKPARLSAEEQVFLDNQVEHLCAKIDDWQVYQDGDLSQEVWDYMKKEKFFGMEHLGDELSHPLALSIQSRRSSQLSPFPFDQD